MKGKWKLNSVKCATALFIALIGSCAAFAERFKTEAELYPHLFLTIPALQVGEKFYEAHLDYRDSSWVLNQAINILPIDSDYLTGTYANGVLELDCVNFNGNVYSARLASTTPGAHIFTLVSYQKLAACPVPAGIGAVRGQWLRTAEPPLSARNYASLAWTGSEILVLGGMEFFCPALASCAAPSDPPFRDGAAYNPATGSWRRIADAPAGITGSTVTTGTDVFVFGFTTPSSPQRLLRYQSARDRWDEFELPTSSHGMMAAFGTRLVLYSQTDPDGNTPDWLLDPATGQWTQLPQHPLGPGFSRQYVAAGTDLYLFDRALTASPGGADGPSYLRAARLRGQQWTVLATADSLGPAPGLVAGSRLIAPVLGCADGGRTNGYGRCIPYGAVFDTKTDTWQALPDAPGRGIKYFESAGAIGIDTLMLLKPGRPALDATTNEWFIVPQLDVDRNTQRSMAGTGPYGFAFGGASATGELLRDAWIWVP